ncbi:fibronectin type III domain-containing protein [[Eubacterium] cellulosolvens]
MAQENTTSDDETLRSTRSVARSRNTLGFTEISTGLPNSDSYNFVELKDFNSDGNIDLVVTAEDSSPSNSKGVHAFTGNGGISWTNATTGLIWQYAWAGLAVGDADGDGYTEAYATDEQHGSNGNLGVKVWEYRSNIWNSSSTHVSSPVSSGRPFNVCLSNFTGTSRPDLVICGNPGLKYFENTGGNPATWQERSSGLLTTNQFTGITAADMNKDGLKDFVACDYTNNEYLYIQNTTGNLWVNYYNGVNISGRYMGVAVGDVNNDTHMDIIFGGVGNGLRCLLGNSGGGSGTSFTWTAANSGLPGGGNYLMIELVDIDDDGDLDIVAPRYGNPGGINIYLGNGNTNPGTSMSWSLATNTNLTSSGDWISVACTDINKDGSIDIAGASWGNGVKAWLNNLTLDITPPAAVLDLVITNVTINSIRVNWTAPADNGTNVSTGPVRSYDIRYMTSNINTGNWASAIQCDDEPTPGTPGTEESYTVTGLQPGTRYYIGLRCLDERPNTSPLSNIVNDITLGIPDTTAPWQIRDLRAVHPTNNSINLTWTAPADNGSNADSGAVHGYEIKIHSAQITNLTWESATELPNAITPAAPGNAETFMVSGLQAETTYYFAVKGFDEVPNTGWVSNSAFNTTLPDPDIIPPNAVTDLKAIEPTLTTINLTWTTPGDDGSSGTASAYDIRYAPANITELTWPDAIECLNEPVPQSAGSTEQYQVTGLTQNTTYYFALKVSDEVPSWSGLSNIAFNTTTEPFTPSTDTLAPAKIIDLIASQPTLDSITLTWTAPGDDGTTGHANAYDIRTEKSPINDLNWNFATRITEPPTPKSAGENETLVVTGLEENTTYYFAIRASDEVPNWSPMSNVAYETTLDSTAPTLQVTMTPEKTVLEAGERIIVVITVQHQGTAEPVSEAGVELSSNNPELQITPASSLTGPNGNLTVFVTAPTLTEDTEITIFAEISKPGFATVQHEVTIIVKAIVITQPKFNLRITPVQIILSKAVIIDGDSIIIYANITNLGPMSAPEFIVRIFLNNEQLGENRRLTNLMANGFMIIEQPWTAVKGNYSIKVDIEPMAPGFDSDLSDNTAERSFVVQEKADDGGDGDGKGTGDSSNRLLWVIILVIIVVVILVLVFIVVRNKRKKEREYTEVPPILPEEYLDLPIETQETIAKTAAEGEEMVDEGPTPEATHEPPVDEHEPPAAEIEPAPELPPQELGDLEMPEQELELEGESGMQEVFEPDTDSMKEPGEELEVELQEQPPTDQEQIPKQPMQLVPCPICQNMIPVYSTPCSQCKTELNWK